MLSWAEISMRPNRLRFDALSEAMREFGIENLVEYIVSDQTNFAASLADAQIKFKQIKIGKGLCEWAPQLTDQMPSMMLTLRTADSFMSDGTGRWWPRSFLIDGFARALVHDIKTVDITGAVFILGATGEARALVAALARLGFSRFTIADPDDSQGRAFIELMRKSHFGVQFQFVSRLFITQLPSIHSVAINALDPADNDGILSELFYFNFLKTAGIWLDLAFGESNLDLEAEARVVGATVLPSYRVAVWSDVEWIKELTGRQLDPDLLSKKYQASIAEFKNLKNKSS